MAIELRDIEQVKFLGTTGYETMDAANDTIGSTPTELRVTNTAAVTDDLEMSENILVRPYGKGVFNISSGKELRINSIWPQRQKLNSGAGILSFGKNALKEFDLVYWLGLSDAVTMTAAMEAGLFESFYQNNGGFCILPTADISWTGGGAKLPSGAITFQGRGTTQNGYGTVIKPLTDDSWFFRVDGVGGASKFRDLCIDMSARVGVTAFWLESPAAPALQHIDIENVSFIGGKYAVHMDGGAGNDELIIGVTVRKCFMTNQSHAGVMVGTRNCSLTLADNNISPAWNGTSVGVDNPYGGVIDWQGVNTINGRNLTIGDHHASFVDADVNTTTGVITIAGHRFTNTNAMTTSDVEAVNLWNFGGALPTGWTAGTGIEYYVRWGSSSTITLHTTPAGVLANTGKVIPSLATGGGTHTARAVTAKHTKFLEADVNTSTGVLTARAHGIPSGHVCAGVLEGSSLPAGWPALTRLYARRVDADHLTLHLDKYSAANNYVILVPTTDGSGDMWLKLMQPMLSLQRPLASIRSSDQTNVQSIKGIQDEGFPYSLIVEAGDGNYASVISIEDCIMQSIKLIQASVSIYVKGGQHNGMAFQDIPDVSAVVYAENVGVQTDYGDDTVIDVSYSRLPQPGWLDSFQGNSRIASDRRANRNTMFGEWVRIFLADVAAYAFPNEPLLGLYSPQENQPLLELGYGSENVKGARYAFARRGSAGAKTGWMKLSGTDAASGLDVDMPLEIKGAFSNQTVQALAGSGASVLHLGDASYFSLTPSGDCTLTADEHKVGQPVVLEILTSGTTPRNIEFSTGFKAKGVFNTGNVSGVYTILRFYSNGTYAVEDESRAALILPQISLSADTTFTRLHANRQILHPAADTNNRTFTIDSNANLALDIGTSFVIVNEINTLTVAITSDTMTLQGANTTGSVTIPAGSTGTFMKVGTTKWIATVTA